MCNLLFETPCFARVCPHVKSMPFANHVEVARKTTSKNGDHLPKYLHLYNGPNLLTVTSLNKLIRTYLADPVVRRI